MKSRVITLFGGLATALATMPIMDDIQKFYKTTMLKQSSDANTDMILLWKKIPKNNAEKAKKMAKKAARIAGTDESKGGLEAVMWNLRRRLTNLGIEIFVAEDDEKVLPEKEKKYEAIWLLSAPFEVLYRTAESMELHKACMGQHGRKGFYIVSLKTYRLFSQCPGFGTRYFFSSSERQRLVSRLVMKVKNDLRAVVPQLVSADILEMVPLHNAAFRNNILWQHIISPGSLGSLDKTAEYFGTEFAFYLAWLAHYTQWLMFPAVLGIGLFITDYNFYGMSPYSIMFAMLMCVWMAFYLSFWTRRCNFLKVRWGVLDFKDREVLDEPRPGFKGFVRTSPVTNKPEIHSKGSKRYFKMYMVSLPLTIGCLYFAFLTMTFTLALQDYCQEFYLCRASPLAYMPSILYSVSIPVLDMAYKFVAEALTSWENHKTHSAHIDALIIKRTCFYFINNNLSLFYIFFWLRDLPRLRRQLQTLMITTQLMSILVEVGLPYFQAKYALFQAEQLNKKKNKNKNKNNKNMKTKTKMKDSEHEEAVKGDNDDAVEKNNNRETDLGDKSQTKRASSFPGEQTNQTGEAVAEVAAAAAGGGGGGEKESKEDDQEQKDHKLQQQQQQEEEEEEQEGGGGGGENTLEEEDDEEEESKGDAAASHDDNNNNDTTTSSSSSSSSGSALFKADIKLDTYEGLLTEYFTVLRDHGYVVMFGWCWGLAPLCALVANLVQLRFDMWKICTSYRRPPYQDADGIGAWDTVLRVYAILFIAVIFAMLAMYELVISAEDADAGAEPFCNSIGIWARQMAESMSLQEGTWLHEVFEVMQHLEESTNATKLLVIVVLEHMVFALLFLFTFIVPSMPGHVRTSIQRRRYIEHQLVKQQLQASSTRTKSRESYCVSSRRSMHFDKTCIR